MQNLTNNSIFNSLLYIPTNRPAETAIEQSLQEVKWANKNGSPTIFCLIENQLPDSISQKHQELLRHKTTEIGVPSLHFTEKRADIFVKLLLENLTTDSMTKRRLKRLLLPNGLSYGRGPNLAALLGGVLGCQLIHRRDSDVYRDKQFPEQLPIALELEVADRPLSELTNKVRRIDEFEPAPKAAVRIVGTSSFGSPTIDRRDLIEAGIEFLVDFQQLGRLGVKRDRVKKEVIEYTITEPSKRYNEVFFEIDIDNRIEMESCCLSEIFKYLPEMPTDVLGCDYMSKDLIYRSRDGLVFHSRKIHHQHTSERERQISNHVYIDYILRDVMYLQLGRIWQRHNQQMEKFWHSHYGIETFDPVIYTKSFLSASTACEDSLREVRLGAEKVYASAARATRGNLSKRLRLVSESIKAAGNQLDRHVQQAVDDYCFLVNYWQQIFQSAIITKLPTDWITK